MRLCLFCMAAAVMLVSGELAASSADEDQSVVNYAYAVFFGTGIDMTFPWGLTVFGQETGFANSLIYYLYLDNPSFEQGDDRSKSFMAAQGP